MTFIKWTVILMANSIYFAGAAASTFRHRRSESFEIQFASEDSGNNAAVEMSSSEESSAEKPFLFTNQVRIRSLKLL